MTNMETLHDKIHREIKEIVGHLDFPLSVEVLYGKVVKIEYEPNWKTGSSEPIISFSGGLDIGGELVKIEELGVVGDDDYLENYQDNQLTEKQIFDLGNYIEQITGVRPL